jgi:DNA-binding MarR family transcriptional regulator
VVDDPSSARPALVDGLVQLAFAVQSVLADAAGQNDLSIPQLRLLGVLRDRRPGMLELATLFGVDKSSMTGLVDRAEQRGLVRREPAAHDRRGVQVCLNPAGSTLAAAVETDVYRRISQLTASLSRREQDVLEALVTRLTGDRG